MTNLKTLIASSSLIAVMAALPATANNASETPAGLLDVQTGSNLVERDQTSIGSVPTSDVIDDEYGLQDAQLDTAESQFGGSMGEDIIPVEEQLERDKGIVDNQVETADMGAVTTSDDAAIGKITRIVPTGQGFDTVYIQVSETLDSPVSNFKINVPTGEANDGKVELAWTLSELLNTLEAQI
jgi:hypothetical protein